MKKFLGFMMCLIMLCIGTVQAKESKESKQPKIEQSCIDVGKVLQVESIQSNQIPDVGQMVVDNYIIHQSDIQSLDNYTLHKDALISQYRYAPDCPMAFIGRHKVKYATHYTYTFSNPYNQPPNRFI